jgi:hypothetical protein
MIVSTCRLGLGVGIVSPLMQVSANLCLISTLSTRTGAPKTVFEASSTRYVGGHHWCVVDRMDLKRS